MIDESDFLLDGPATQRSIRDYDEGISASAWKTREDFRVQDEAEGLKKAKEVYTGFDSMRPEDQKVLLDVIHAETNREGYRQGKLVEARLAQAARKINPEYDALTADQQKELRYQAENREAEEYREFAGKYRAEHSTEFPQNLDYSSGVADLPSQPGFGIENAWHEQQSKLPDYIQEKSFFEELQRQYLANREKLFGAYPDLKGPFEDEFDKKPIS